MANVLLHDRFFARNLDEWIDPASRVVTTARQLARRGDVKATALNFQAGRCETCLFYCVR